MKAKRDRIVQVRMTAKDHARFMAAADADGRTLSDWIRRAVETQLQDK